MSIERVDSYWWEEILIRVIDFFMMFFVI